MIENFIVGIITSIVTAFAVWIWRSVRESKILRSKARFFSISPKDTCLAVMNHNPHTRDTMSHGDIETLVDIVMLVDEIGGKLKIAPFDKVLEPAGEMTEFCIGSPGSNKRTQVHMENFLKGVVCNPYAPGDPDNLAIVAGNEKFRYESYESEYALLARFYPNTNSQPVILISGQSARGNQGAVYYLIRRYDNFLKNKFDDKKPFCLILRLQSPLTYGHKSVRLVKDITDVAFIPFSTTV